jgi:hypothetical protein
LELEWGAVFGDVPDAAAEGAEDAEAAAFGAAGEAVLDDGMLVGGVLLARVRMDEDELTADDLDVLPPNVPDAVRAEATMLLELLLVHGVGADAAKAKVAELFSPPRVTKELKKVRSLHLAPGSTFDLVADASGQV